MPPAGPAHAVETKSGLAARQAAIKLLSAVLDRQTPLDGMLDANGGNPAYRALGAADRALVRAILIAALRRLPQIDAVIDALVDKALPQGALSLRRTLQVAAAQILFLNVPDRAAVDLAVEHARADPRLRRFSGLINALLRRMSTAKTTLMARASAQTPAVPAWFLERLQSAYGDSHADAIAAMLALPPALDLTVRSDADGWAERLGGRVLPTGSVRIAMPQGTLTELAGFAEGAWWVQDAAASLPVRLLGDVAGKRVLDLCAAPGGKTAQLAAAGARVTALDRSPSRLKRLAANLDRLGLAAEIVEGDARTFTPAEPFYAILLDAPCSATGTARRHPDVLWTKNAEAIARLADLQRTLLGHAAALLPPGGRLVFSNCSLDPEEGECVVEAVLAETGLCRRPLRPADWPGLEDAVSQRGDLRTTPAMLPDADPALAGMDGFYAAILERRP